MNKQIIIFSIILALIFIFLLFPGSSYAATLYIDSAQPDDFGIGTSWATAKKTIQAGADLLNSGDTLKIKTGSYSAFYLRNRNFSSWTTIETDNGTGSPGLVTISGSVTSGYNVSNQTVVDIQNVSYLKIDGRQPSGFTIMPNASFGIIAWYWSPVSYMAILNTDVIGSVVGTGDASAIMIYEYNNVEIGYCRINTTGSAFLIEIVGAGTGDPNTINGGSVHHCDIQGNTGDGYSAISITRFGQAEVYDNYIHNVRANAGTGSTLMRVRNGHDNKFYNNVLLVDSGTTIRNFFQWRGSSDGTGISNRNQYYNNTGIIEGSLAGSVLQHNDISNNNKSFNNLIIGNVITFVDTWGALISGSNNELYNNVVTGNLNRWFDDASAVANFSVTSGGTSNQGTAFINFSGNKPSPYYELTASYDGSSLGAPALDYNGANRISPPDVGAFEYISGGPLPDTTPPSSPTGLAVQ